MYLIHSVMVIAAWCCQVPNLVNSVSSVGYFMAIGINNAKMYRPVHGGYTASPQCNDKLQNENTLGVIPDDRLENVRRENRLSLLSNI